MTKHSLSLLRHPSRLSPLHWLAVSAAIVPVDYATGPSFSSMVLLYPIPAAMAGWSEARGWTVALSVVLPCARVVLAHLWGWPTSAMDAAANTAVTVLVSLVLGLLVLRLRRQAREIRTLEGMLPICAFCKRIRSGETWEPLEEFVTQHSEATFSHTFCPDCGAKHYPTDLDS